ncbi:UPF0481 protein At3g47200-like isoform X2 [Elaeis guineensis]|uniref:UPF0481 protein At3g47200-like isoform X2 n=1 Tax=Elaeis guineensis var. tenera TaxID=51953 RepID=UPI003C6D8846
MSDSDSETAQVPSEPDSDSETPPENSKAAQWFREEEDFTIYGVPPEIFERDRKAYQPKAVCIGPFFREWRHRGHLEVMQQYKWECTKRLMPKKDTREKCLTEMKELEASVRQKYSEKFPKIISDDFARMLMLDGCFLLHLLRRYAPGPEEPKSGHKEAKLLVGRMQIWELVRYDLLLLQNQIPFCVIQRLHEFLYPDDSNTNLVDCAINFFSSLRPCRKLKQSRFYIQVKDVHHLLHLIYSSLLPCPKYGTSSSGPKSSRRWIPSATELQLAGMNFKRRESANGFLSFLDVKFSDGVMEIPKIKDMRLLHLKEILIDLTTVDKDKGATHFFSRLCNEVGNNKNYLGKLFSDVMDYHDTPLNKWRAELNEKYFKSPLTIISLTAGAIALPLSVASNIKNIFF